jgi:hypothetical protein
MSGLIQFWLQLRATSIGELPTTTRPLRDATRGVQLWQMNGTEILVNSQMALLADGWHMVV